MLSINFIGICAGEQIFFNMENVYVFGALSIFGSTYVCELPFSTMNDVENKRRSLLTDDSLLKNECNLTLPFPNQQIFVFHC